MEVHNIIQEAANKTFPKKKKSKKAKWLSEEALQRTEQRREAKSKGERERYIQLDTDFQRTAWRQEGLLQWTVYKTRRKQEKYRDLFRKIGRYQRNISPKDGHNRGQKWWRPSGCWRDGKNTPKNCTKQTLNWIATMVWSVTQSDILCSEVKWALGKHCC